MSKRQVYLWTAAVAAVCIAVSVVLQAQGIIPNWAGSAVAVVPTVLVMVELDKRRKQGQERSVPATLWMVLQASLVTAVALAGCGKKVAEWD